MTKTHQDQEFYAPPKGLDLEGYIKAANKQGVHHSIRYVWAIEAIKELGGIRRILDYGCGDGYGAFGVAQAFPHIEVVAMDYDDKGIENAKKKYQAPNLTYRVGDVRQSYDELKDNSFDLVISFDVVEHIEHRELYFYNIVRYLKKNGRAFLSTPCGGPRSVRANPGWEHHKIEYNCIMLYDVLSRYFGKVFRIDDTRPTVAQVGIVSAARRWLSDLMTGTSGDVFPAKRVFKVLEGQKVQYLNMLNPVICSNPIKIDNPYRFYATPGNPLVAFKAPDPVAPDPVAPDAPTTDAPAQVQASETAEVVPLQKAN